MKRYALVSALLLALCAPLAGQDVDKARQLLQQALAALQPPAPAPAAIASAAALDAALAAAQPGAVLVLSRSLVYSAPLVLAQPGVALQAEALPAPARVDLALPLPLFKDGILVQADNVSLVGLEVRRSSPTLDIVRIAGANALLDRVRILGDPAKGGKRGIAANGGGNVRVLRSYVADCFGPYPGDDTQALAAWDMAPGLLLEDNYFAGGTETLLFGGADSSSAARMPSGIVVRGNAIAKNPAWQALPVGVKNTIELKAAVDVIIENNDIAWSWGGRGQDGYLFLATVRNQGGKAPWSTIANVRVIGNRFAHGAGAINILGLDNNQASQAAAGLLFRNNDFADLDPKKYSGSNRMVLIGGGPSQVIIDANTFAGANLGAQVYFYGAPALALQLTGNTWPAATYGLKGDGQASGAATLAAYAPGAVVSGNNVR